MSGKKNRDGLSPLKSISQGAGLFLIGRVVKNLIGFITNIILTRTLGTSLYGIYSYLNTVFSLFRIFTNLGGDNSIIRYLPEYDGDSRMRRVVLTVAYLTSLIASVVVAVAVYYIAPLVSQFTLNEPLFIDVLRIGALMLPFNTLANLTYSSFKAIERMDYHVAVSSVARPILRLVFVGGAVLLGYSVIGAVAGLIVTGICTFLLSIAILLRKTNLGGFELPTRSESREYYNYSIPLSLNNAGSYLYSKVDVLMVGILLSSSAVGVYNISVMLAGFLSLPLTGFNQLFPPIASKLYHSGDHSQLESVYRTITRWIFTASLFPGLALMTYAEEVLWIFGENFTEGYLVLILFTISQLINCAVGASGYLLMMTDHQYVTMLNQLLLGVLNVVLNYIFIIQYGFIGAAVATASVLALINLLRVSQVWYFEGYNPYNWSYLKPICAGVVSVLIMITLSNFFTQYVLLAVGGTLGGLFFFGILLILGFEEEEVDLAKQIIS